MLKKIIDKRNYLILFIIIVLIIFLLINNSKIKEHSKHFYYFSENIIVNIYTNKNTDKVFQEIDSIYKKYNEYYKKPNHNTDKELIDLLKYGKNLYQKSNGLIDITTGKLMEKYNNDEKFTFESSVDKLDFKDKNTLNNLSLDIIIGSYANRKKL